MMPNMDGFELTRRLRQDPRTATVSVIMLTARGLSADKLEGFAIGADDYIVKPFDTPELLARIRGVLRRSRDMRTQSPLTGLPGNVRIEEEIDARVDARRTVRDPVRRPRPLQGLQRPLRVHARRRGDPGRRRSSSARPLAERQRRRRVRRPRRRRRLRGGRACPSRPAGVADAIVAAFDEAAPGFYDDADRERGYIEVTNRRGELQRFGMLTLSIGIATTAKRSVPALRRGRGRGDRDEAVHEGRPSLVVGDGSPRVE